ncbi:T9SS type A sorting domain-containing protein [Ekhidna sp.]|uniref:T9SS type A sorting domain-containing protein n=1 Tax=Ekhidna sp. TaxID=2608089 RepID=UPI003CCBE038
MKKLYNNILYLRALMLVMLTGLFAFSANAQAPTVSTTTFPTGLVVNKEATFTFNAQDFPASTTFILWDDADNDGLLDTDEDILGTSTVDDGTDQDIDFTPESSGTLRMRFNAFTGDIQEAIVDNLDNSEVTVVGTSQTDFTYTFGTASTRQLTTDAFDVSASETITVTVNLGFNNADTDNPLEVQYSQDGFATAGLPLDWNGGTESEIVSSDGTNFTYVLPSGAKSANTSFRIVQKGTVDYGTGKSWSVASISIQTGNAYAKLSADYDNNAGTPDTELANFSSDEAVALPGISLTDTDPVGVLAATIYPGDQFTINGSISDIMDISAGKGVAAVFRDPDGVEVVIGSDATIDNTNGNFSIVDATIPTDITYNSSNTWDLFLRAFEGTSPQLGLEFSETDFTDLFPEDLEFDDFTVEGGEREAGEGIVFDEDATRQVTTQAFNITGTTGEINFDIARKNNLLSASGTEVVVEYSTDGTTYAAFTELILNEGTNDEETVSSIDLNAIDVDDNSTPVTISNWPAGAVSTSTSFRIRQSANGGADLDAFIIRDFDIENESNIIPSTEINQLTLSTTLDVERPVIALDQITVGGDGQAFPGESLTFTYDVTDGAFPASTGAELFIDQEQNGFNPDLDLSLTSITDVTTESITFTVPTIERGQYNIYLVVNDEVYSSVPLQIYGLAVEITSIDITDPIVVGGEDRATVGGSITVNYSISEGSLSTGAQVMLNLEDDNGDFIMIGSAADAASSGSIAATLPTDFDYAAGSTQTVELSVDLGTDVLDYSNTEELVSFENFTLDESLDSEIFETVVGATRQGDNSDIFDQAGDRSATTVSLDVSTGASVTAVLDVIVFNSSFDVVLEASTDGTTWEEIDDQTITFNADWTLSANLENSLWSSTTKFRIVSEDATASQNTFEIQEFTVDIPELVDVATDEETFELQRPSLTVNAYESTDFNLEESITVDFTAIGFTSDVEYALVLRADRGDAEDEEFLILGKTNTLTNGAGTITGTIPNVVPTIDDDSDGSDGFDIEVIPYIPATAGGDYEEGEEVPFNSIDDYLSFEGTSSMASTFTFNENGERFFLSNAIDLSDESSATLEFTTNTSFGSGVNKNLVPRVEITTDGGATFTVVEATYTDADGDDASTTDGLLYDADTYEVELPVGTATTHFRISQPLNLGSNENTFGVSSLTVTLGDENALDDNIYTTSANNEQSVDINTPATSNFLFAQADLQDAVFNGETFTANWDIKSDLNPDNVPLFPSGSLFEFYLHDGTDYIIDPETNLPLIIGSTTALGDFTATIPFYVENDNYDVEVAVSLMVDGEKVYLVGDEDGGNDVGDLAVFLRVVNTEVDFDANDILYAGETVTVNIDIENDESNTAGTDGLFATLLIKNYSGGDDLVVATQEGVDPMTVDLPPYVRGSNFTFEVQLSEGAALGSVGDLIGDTNDLTNLEDDVTDNFVNGFFEPYALSAGPATVVESDRYEAVFDIEVTSGSVQLYRSIDGGTPAYINFYGTGTNLTATQSSESGTLSPGSTVQFYWYFTGDATIENVVIREDDESGEENQIFSGELSNVDPEDATGGSFDLTLSFENTNGRGLITTRPFEAGELDGTTLIEFDLTFNKTPEDLTSEQYLIFEYSIDGGATYTELGTFPDVDEPEENATGTYLVDVLDDMKSNESIFRFRVEERNGNDITIDKFSFKSGNVLPFEYQSDMQNIANQVLLVTSVGSEQSCLVDDIVLSYEVRGSFGADNIVTVSYDQVNGSSDGSLTKEFAGIVSGTGTLEGFTLPTTVFASNDNNKNFRFRLNYDDDTYKEDDEDYESTSEPLSEKSLEVVAKINLDAEISVASGDKACEGESLMVNIDDVQNYFTYEVIDTSDDSVLGTLTYDPEDGETEVDLGVITEDVVLGLQITSNTSTGTACRTLTSTFELEVELVENGLAFVQNTNLSIYEEVANGQSIDLCEDAAIDLRVGRDANDASFSVTLVEWFRDDINTPIATGSAIDEDDINNKSGDYFARITDGECQYNTEAITINIIASPDKPSITLTSGGLIGCEGADPAILEATDGFAYYEWSTPSGTLTSRVIEAEDEGTYTVRVSNFPFNGTNSGCASASSDPVYVERYELAEFGLSKTGSITAGDVVVDGEVIDACESQIIYFHDETSWTASGGTIEIIRDGVSDGFTTSSFVTLDQSGDYSFNWINDDVPNNVSACTVSSVTFTLNIFERPDAVTVSTTDATDFCEGEGSVTITAPAGFAQYRWLNNGSVIDSNSDGFGNTNNSITVDYSGLFSVQVSNEVDGTSCFSTQSNEIDVNVRQYAFDGVGVNQVGILCGPGTARYEITGTLDDYNYQIYNNVTDAAVGNPFRGNNNTASIFVDIDVTEQTDFYVISSYASGEGCPSPEPSTTFTVSFYNVELELDGNNIRAVTSGGFSYDEIEWFRNGVRLQQRSGDNSIFVTDNAEYSAEVTFDDGACVITTNAVAVEGARIQTFFGELNASTYPNPSSDFINVDMKGGDLGSYAVSVANLSGQVMLSEEFNKTEEEDSMTVDIRSIEKGIYTLIIRKGNEIQSFRIVKK